MTNDEKRELKQLCRSGYSFERIKRLTTCSDTTIKKYIKCFSQKKEVTND